MSSKPVLGILLGDSAGVGPEIVAKAMASGFLTDVCRPLVIGDCRTLEQGMQAAGVRADYAAVSSVYDINWSDAIPVLDQKNQDPAIIEIGKVSAYTGQAVIDMLELACSLCELGDIAGFVFAPLNKASMLEAGCIFESETKMLADRFKVTGPYCEINVLDSLMTTRVTSHVPIAKVSENLTIEGVLQATRLSYITAKRAGIETPRIGISALNPHCGEGGRCGREEIDIIAPAIDIAVREGIDATGPYSADILFIRAFRGDFDSVVTMYHDQGQIALKLKGPQLGVTVIGGIPYPVATPAHGTAFDIAGQGITSTAGFENAVRLAAKMAVGS